ncbi:MAG TPA: S-methyl-5-thioribose-1-phosphate isomerase, partial [Stenomitos sp.]
MSFSTPVYPVVWQNDHVRLIDQTRLPTEYSVVEIKLCSDMAAAIKTMIVRGAPAIGVAAAYGLYLGAREIPATEPTQFLTALEEVAQTLAATRPTAVNLFWALSRMLKVAKSTPGSVEQIQARLLDEAHAIAAEDLQTCQAIGQHGLSILPQTREKLRLLTH